MPEARATDGGQDDPTFAGGREGCGEPADIGRIVLETERLALRRLAEADAGFLHELTNEPSYRRFLSLKPADSVDQAREWLGSRYQPSYARQGFGLYGVILRATGEVMGLCGLVQRERLADVDLGYGFLRRYWGHGYALEAARAVVEHARRDVGLRRLVAVTHPDNEPSIRLLERLGMAREGQIELTPGTPPDALYALVLQEPDPGLWGSSPWDRRRSGTGPDRR